ncbi:MULTISPECIES: FAD-binding oxidoreductase [unclassified Chelatococcus]|uniref:NAD(P)/FAD-dependent oxidoreductase n=1 Tax=unclassified Chelatococcus TaxID=2638111 RepID=UPI001BCE1DB9|nr:MULTISPECIES: FAD-binding oxidoreductase [unclassified Chelatococcus]MBS7700381.1 FAD-binding oxidoreductase [Chelatococcus sp. YT9]MBX3556177.1 FAD-binding oxidoreductase [Chelatococcus sp.]
MNMNSIYVDNLKLTPYWWEAAPRAEVQCEELPARADTVIVGSGYSGLTAAVTLAEAGQNVVVIDAGALGVGASTRNGGAIGATLRYSFATLVGKVGLENAVRFYKAAVRSREFVFDLIESRGIDCGLERCGRFYGAHKPEDYESLARDMDLRTKHLGATAHMVSRAEQRAYVGTNEYFGGRLMPEDGHLHPGLYHDGLVDQARRAGVTLVSNCRVKCIGGTLGQFDIDTQQGMIRAKRAIVATNAYTGAEFGWFRRRLVPIQSQIIATEPLPPDVVGSVIPRGHQIGDTCKLHNYYRTSPDGTRILFGGRSGASQVNDFRRSGRSLHRRMRTLFPQLEPYKITHSWGGFIAFTFDHFPHMTERNGIHYIGGCCGSGVAMQSYLGHETAKKLLGGSWEQAFDRPYATQMFYTGNPWFMPAIIGFLEARDRLRI